MKVSSLYCHGNLIIPLINMIKKGSSVIMYTRTCMVHMGIITDDPPLYEGDDQVAMTILTFIIPLHKFTKLHKPKDKIHSLHPMPEGQNIYPCSCKHGPECAAREKTLFIIREEDL